MMHYIVDKNRLVETVRSSSFGDTDILRSRSTQKNDGKTVISGIDALRKDSARSLFLNGRRLNAAQNTEIETFLKENNLTDFVLGYTQDAAALSEALMMYFTDRLPNSVSALPWDQNWSGGSTFFNKDLNVIHTIGIMGGLKLPFKSPDGNPQYYTIPGELFVKGQKSKDGYLSISSISASNALFRALFEYAPIKILQNGVESYTYPPLKVYGYEIVNNQGQLNRFALDAARIIAEREEAGLTQQYGMAKNKFSDYCERKPEHQLINELILKHTVVGATEEDSLARNSDDAYALCLSTSRAIALYCDLPAVLEGEKKLADCPLLIEAMAWCGNPKLTEEIKTTLSESGKVSQAELKELIMQYGQADDAAMIAQNKIAFEIAEKEYHDAANKDEPIESQYKKAEAYYYAALSKNSLLEILYSEHANFVMARKLFEVPEEMPDKYKAAKILYGAAMPINAYETATAAAEEWFSLAQKNDDREEVYAAAKALYSLATQRDREEDQYDAAIKIVDHSTDKKEKNEFAQICSGLARKAYTEAENPRERKGIAIGKLTTAMQLMSSLSNKKTKKVYAFKLAQALYESMDADNSKEDKMIAAVELCQKMQGLYADKTYNAQIENSYYNAKQWYEAALFVSDQKEHKHENDTVNAPKSDELSKNVLNSKDKIIKKVHKANNEFLHEIEISYNRNGVRNGALLARALSYHANALTSLNENRPVAEDNKKKNKIYADLLNESSTKKVASKFMMVTGVLLGLAVLTTLIVGASVFTGGTHLLLMLPIAAKLGLLGGATGAISSIFTGVATRYSAKKDSAKVVSAANNSQSFFPASSDVDVNQSTVLTDVPKMRTTH